MKFIYALLIWLRGIPVFAQNYFTWDNATVYFLLTDRFNNGNTGNDQSYGRGTDPVGGFFGGDFVGLTQKISNGYFDDLGVNALWISPPYEQIHGHVTGYGNDPAFQDHYAYHGYYALDFTEPDANFGTFAEFQALVDTAHAHGIRIVLDIVLNHVGYDNTADSNEFGLGAVGSPNDPNWCNWWTDPNGAAWIRKDGAGEYCSPAAGGDDLTMALAGLPDVRTDYTSSIDLPNVLLTKWNATKETQEINELNTFFTNTGLTATPANYIIKWLTDWVREYGVDGFRIDTYKHVERAIWGELKIQSQAAFNEWKTNNPAKKLDDTPFWMVGEWYGHGPGKNAEAVNVGLTDALINFQFQGQAGTPTNLEATYANYASIVNPDPEWNILSYISSHDTQLFDRNDLVDGGTSLLLAPGAVQIFYGDETARPLLSYNTGTDQDTRSFMNWGSPNNTVLTHWQKIGTFRQKHPAIGAGTHTLLQSSSPYMFSREYQNVTQGICDFAVIALGLSAGTQTINVASVFADNTQIRNYYTNEIATVTGGNLTFTVGAEGVMLLEYVNPPACIITEISPDICYEPNAVEVTISAIDGGNPMVAPTIYYSFDVNADPNNLNDWTIYTTPFTLTQSETVYAFAQNTSNERSAVVSKEYNVGNLPYIYFHWNAANAGCSTPYVYIWDIDGVSNTEVAPWPGVPMTDNDSDGWYDYLLGDACFASVIFNCGSNQNQTANLLAESGNACYDNAWVTCPAIPASTYISPVSGNFEATLMNVSIGSVGGNNCTLYYTTDGTTPDQNSSVYTGSIVIDGIQNTSVTVNAVAYCDGTPTTVASETYTFSEGITLYWDTQATCSTPYVYAWNLNGQSGTQNAAWPGVLMTDEDGDDWYDYTLAGATCANVIFSCGSNQNQSLDYLNICSDSCFVGASTAGAWTTCPTFSSSNCITSLTISNNPIPPDTYSVEQYIFSAGSVATGTTVVFKAEDYIVLQKGFNSNAGTDFTAKIEACTPVAKPVADSNNENILANKLSSIGSFNAKSKIVVSPNPTSGSETTLYFYGYTTEKVQVNVLNYSGQVVLQKEALLDNATNTIDLPTTQLASGIYLVQIQTKNNMEVIKLVVTH